MFIVERMFPLMFTSLRFVKPLSTEMSPVERSGVGGEETVRFIPVNFPMLLWGLTPTDLALRAVLILSSMSNYQ